MTIRDIRVRGLTGKGDRHAMTADKDQWHRQRGAGTDRSAQAQKRDRAQHGGDGHEREAELGLVHAIVPLRHGPDHFVGQPAGHGGARKPGEQEREVRQADLRGRQVVRRRAEHGHRHDADGHQPREEAAVDKTAKDDGRVEKQRERQDDLAPERLVRHAAAEDD